MTDHPRPQDRTIRALTALGQETRLSVFRELLRHAREGLTAGEISNLMGILPNTLSGNLAILANAGLIRSQREGRHIRYHADMAGLQQLLSYLIEDCCGGNPGECAAILDGLPMCEGTCHA